MPTVASENRGVAVTLPTEPNKEEVPPIPATNPGASSEGTGAAPPMTADPEADRRKEEEARTVPDRDKRSVMMPPGAALPDGRVLYAPSGPVRQLPATRPSIFPVKGPKGAVAPEKSGGAGVVGKEGDTVPVTPPVAVPVAPAPKPRLNPFFKPKKAQANEVLPAEPNPQRKE